MQTVLALGPADHGRAIHLEEFEHAHWQEGSRYELIDGRLCVSPVPNPLHDWIVVWINGLLCRYAEQHPTVINYVSTGSRVWVAKRPKATQPQPDVAGYHDYPLGEDQVVARWQDVSPLFVVEVVSEEDPNKDLVRNVELYELVPSIREYWIFDPRAQPTRPSLRVYRRRGQRWQRPKDFPFGSTYTTPLLPGLVLPVDPRVRRLK
jgi:Uma2 family endonuclease